MCLNDWIPISGIRDFTSCSSGESLPTMKCGNWTPGVSIPFWNAWRGKAYNSSLQTTHHHISLMLFVLTFSVYCFACHLSRHLLFSQPFSIWKFGVSCLSKLKYTLRAMWLLKLCFCSKMASEAISDLSNFVNNSWGAYPHACLCMHAYMDIRQPCNPPSNDPGYGPVHMHMLYLLYCGVVKFSCTITVTSSLTADRI